MKSLIFDIETVPDFAGIKKITPDMANINDINNDELLIAFWKKRKPNITDAEALSAFLPTHLHRIVSIGIAIADLEENSFNLVCLSAPEEKDEKTILTNFFAGIKKYSNNQLPAQLISWNGGGFDLPVIHHRSMIHSVASSLYWEVGEKRADFRFNNYLNRYQYRHLDIMDVLAMYSVRNFAKLDDIARLCGFPGKKGMDGSAVASEFAKGNLDDICKYCEADVLNTYLLYLRFLLISNRIDNSKYTKSIDSVNLWLGKNKANDDFWQSIIQQMQEVN